MNWREKRYILHKCLTNCVLTGLLLLPGGLPPAAAPLARGLPLVLVGAVVDAQQSECVADLGLLGEVPAGRLLQLAEPLRGVARVVAGISLHLCHQLQLGLAQQRYGAGVRLQPLQNCRQPRRLVTLVIRHISAPSCWLWRSYFCL